MRRPIPLLGLVLAVLPGVLAARALPVTRTVQGVVRTPEGVPIVGAVVWLVDTSTPGDSSIAATSGPDGSYRFSLPVSETSGLLVRRLGFHDTRAPLGATGPAKRPFLAAAVALTPIAPPLATVRVRESGEFTGPAAPFYRHVASRRGTYMTRIEIERHHAVRASGLLRMMPGVSVESGRGGGTMVRLRGHSCEGAVFIDGLPVGGRGFDVDALSPESLAGIEVYTLSSMLPAEYTSVEAASCGAVGFWTRRGSESSGASFDPPSIADLASVHLTTEVDEPVRLTGATAFAPSYPNEARAAGMGGAVTVELVVDTAGVIEHASAGVVSTMAPILGDAAVDATSQLRFRPARKDGRPVRQLVHLVAVFEPGAKR